MDALPGKADDAGMLPVAPRIPVSLFGRMNWHSGLEQSRE